MNMRTAQDGRKEIQKKEGLGEEVYPLAATGVSFGYQPGQPVLEDFSAHVKPGTICALIGPNAVGKSTLLKLMLGQLTPWQGRVELSGRKLEKWTLAERAARMSYVPQRAGASFAFTVREVVEMGRFAVGADEAAVGRALLQCDLAGLEGRTFAALSIGQQQRVLLARAMAQSDGKGEVMLLDEPGSAMDLWHTHHTMGILRELAAGGLGVLVVLHDLNLTARYADEVWLMQGGKLVRHGSWEEVLRPEVLEPVYRVKLRMLCGEGMERPMFDVAAAELG